jgi:hypothetical protein
MLGISGCFEDGARCQVLSLVVIFCSTASIALFCLACMVSASSHELARLDLSEYFEAETLQHAKHNLGVGRFVALLAKYCMGLGV